MIQIHFIGGHSWTTDPISSTEFEPDRAMSDRTFWMSVRIAEHAEIDCEGGGEFECLSCQRNRDGLAEIREERERRDRVGIEAIEDLTEPTFEERFAPFGEEWQIEQRERQEGGW